MSHPSFEDVPLDAAIAAELDTQIKGVISRLLAANATEHDKLVGVVKGLETAKQTVLQTARKWRANEIGERPDPRQIHLDVFLNEGRLA